MARSATPEASRRQLDETVERLRALVPEGWTVTIAPRNPDLGTVSFTADDGTEATVSVLTRERLEPRNIDHLPLPNRPSIVSAAWLSPRSRELLRQSQLSFLDRTGNAELRLRRPALYVRTDGAARDPSPKPAKGPRLRGPRVWALIRTLIEVVPPYTAGDLSSALDLDNGYVSRVLQALTVEQLIERKPRGPVSGVAWEALLRQLATTYSVFSGNETTTWVASSGPERLLHDLAGVGTSAGRWALTGSFLASSIVAVVAPEIAIVYADDPELLAKVGRLLPTTSGVNVIVARPYDPVVFERRWSEDDWPSVSVAQVAVDCLTGSARMPAEGEALVGWMRRNQPRWQAQRLRG